MSQQLRLEQTENLERVSTKIARYVCEFVAIRLEYSQPFTADELRGFVERRNKTIAPASTDRILREQRQKGNINYRVLNRRQSLYEPLPVDAA